MLGGRMLGGRMLGGWMLGRRMLGGRMLGRRAAQCGQEEVCEAAVCLLMVDEALGTVALLVSWSE